MTKIDFDITHLAHLARLELTADEQTKFTGELERVLVFVQQLQVIETTDVAETAQVTGLTNVLRNDELRITNDELSIEELRENRQRLLEAVPQQEQNMVKVPVIL